MKYGMVGLVTSINESLESWEGISEKMLQGKE